MPRRALSWLGYGLPPFVYAGAIVALSAMSHPPLPALGVPYFDKVLHGVEYAGLGALVYRALFAGGRFLPPRGAFLGAVLTCGLFGAGDEVHQAFVPGRSCEALDLLADCTGAALGAAVFWATGLRSRRALTMASRGER